MTSLINLRLLQRVSAADKLLDAVKLKGRLSIDSTGVIAASLGMNDWKQFLVEYQL